MKRNHLGDSVDLWKRGLIGYLRDRDALERVEVVPMLTDDEAWTPDELAAYAKILGASFPDLLGTGPFTQPGRKAYFESVAVSTDVFVDPDTGLNPDKELPKAAKNPAHVSAEECGQLLLRKPPNIVMVYQHAQRTADWAKSQLGILRKALPGVQVFAYQSSVVGMLFLSWDADRLRKVRFVLADLLGPSASGLGDIPKRIVP
jgi:hypothetical protein